MWHKTSELICTILTQIFIRCTETTQFKHKANTVMSFPQSKVETWISKLNIYWFPDFLTSSVKVFLHCVVWLWRLLRLSESLASLRGALDIDLNPHRAADYDSARQWKRSTKYYFRRFMKVNKFLVFLAIYMSYMVPVLSVHKIMSMRNHKVRTGNLLCLFFIEGSRNEPREPDKIHRRVCRTRQRSSSVRILQERKSSGRFIGWQSKTGLDV